MTHGARRIRLVAAIVAAIALWLPAASAALAQTPTPTEGPSPAVQTDEAADLTPVRPLEAGDTGIFGSQAVFWFAILAAFIAVMLLLFFLVVPALDRPAERVLKRGLRIYQRGGEPEKESTAGLATSTLGKAAVGLVRSVPKPAGYEDQLQSDLDRANWPVRASEFITMRVAATIFGALVGWGLLGNIVLGIVFAAAGAVVPGVALRIAKGRREKQFLAQLPDTLTLLAGALKAGYGLLQAVDTVVQESPEPTKQEFNRVLAEARLGLPLNEALDDMAVRVGSDDFRWVVVAINIQAQVGGNLAELLDTIADTLREREMVRRMISALSAEGRLSAIILVALPFVVALYLAVINPAYIGTLPGHWMGRILIGLGLVLMGFGIWWMNKLIKIDV